MLGSVRDPGKRKEVESGTEALSHAPKYEPQVNTSARKLVLHCHVVISDREGIQCNVKESI